MGVQEPAAAGGSTDDVDEPAAADDERQSALRKLLWTFGTDQEFERPAHSPVPPNSIAVTPHNVPRLCHRFGLHCDGQQVRGGGAIVAATRRASIKKAPAAPLQVPEASPALAA